jgi:mannose-1-phosphate guanylyltransferase/MurNAc alpha-1-phosphate uridylyltransferase
MEAHLKGLGIVKVSVEERQPLGTAGALGLLRDWIDNRPVLVHNVDAWHDADIADSMLKEWDGERIRLLVVQARPGMEDFDGWTFAGVSLLPWADVSTLRPEPTGLWEVSWRQAFEDGRVDLVVHDGCWFDTGTPSRYLAANLAASNGASVIAPDAVVEGEVIRSGVWSEATVGAHERLTEKIRAPGPLTVDGALRDR